MWCWYISRVPSNYCQRRHTAKRVPVKTKMLFKKKTNKKTSMVKATWQNNNTYLALLFYPIQLHETFSVIYIEWKLCLRCLYTHKYVCLPSTSRYDFISRLKTQHRVSECLKVKTYITNSFHVPLLGYLIVGFLYPPPQSCMLKCMRLFPKKNADNISIHTKTSFAVLKMCVCAPRG